MTDFWRKKLTEMWHLALKIEEEERNLRKADAIRQEYWQMYRELKEAERDRYALSDEPKKRKA